MKQSAMQAPEEHTSPVPHVVPFAAFVQMVVELAGAQTWQAFAGFVAPDA
jgi:hypothetical protein